MRTHLVVFALVAAIGLVGFPTQALAQHSLEPIEGSSELYGVRGVSVPTVKRTETQTLVDLGTITTDGYNGIVLNLAGQMLGSDAAGGTVGVVLIPDIAPFDQAFKGFNLLPASIEISMTISTQSSPYFMAPQQKFDVGFPRYRALAYNNTRSPLTISFFAYRTR